MFPALPTTFPTNAVTRVYAQALIELAENSGRLEGIAQEVVDLNSLLADDGNGLRSLIESPVLSRQDRLGTVQRIFEGKVDELLYKLLAVLAQKGRLDALAGLTTSFAQLYAEKMGIHPVTATFATEPEEATLQAIRDRLGSALGGTIELDAKTDPSLLGGLRLRVGDQLIDASVATRLKRLSAQLAATGRQQARANQA